MELSDLRATLSLGNPEERKLEGLLYPKTNPPNNDHSKLVLLLRKMGVEVHGEGGHSVRCSHFGGCGMVPKGWIGPLPTSKLERPLPWAAPAASAAPAQAASSTFAPSEAVGDLRKVIERKRAEVPSADTEVRAAIGSRIGHPCVARCPHPLCLA